MESLKHWHRDYIFMVIVADETAVRFKTVDGEACPKIVSLG